MTLGGALPASSPSAPPDATEAPEAAKRLADAEPLEEGRVTFQGMIRPTKGGFDVRGVTLDGGETGSRIRLPSGDSGPVGYDDLLGAVVRVTADLSRVTSDPPEGPLAIQTRSGSWFHADRLIAIELVRRPQVIEGELHPSKGLLSIGQHLVSRQDLGWALAPEGGRDGERVRLYGQPRIYVCRPDEQCLIEGSLPLFDVGRAERLP